MICGICNEICSYENLYSQRLGADPINKHYWCFNYAQARNMITKSKYHKETAHYRHVMKYFKKQLLALSKQEQIELIVPVPTQRTHISNRGYDHSLLMAQCISKITGIPYIQDVLLPGRDFQQVSAIRNERLKAPFYITTKEVMAKSILLIDDVASTFASMNACAYAIKQNTDAKITAFTLAKQH